MVHANTPESGQFLVVSCPNYPGPNNLNEKPTKFQLLTSHVFMTILVELAHVTDDS